MDTVSSRGSVPAFATRAAAALAGFVALTAAAWHHRGPLGIDRTLLQGYTVRSRSAVYRIARVVTELGSPVLVVVVAFVAAGALWLRHGDIMRAGVCVAAPGIAGVAETLAKALVGRVRPATAAITGESGNGFPSGHAAGFTALAVILTLAYFVRPRAKARLLVVVAVCSLLMAATRVIVGAHYPSDVIAGVLLGGLIADTVWFGAGRVPASFFGARNTRRISGTT